MKPDTGWDSYLCIFNVRDDEEAISIRKEVESLCKSVDAKCRPFYFRRRHLNVDSINDLCAHGLTLEENKRFLELAPPGTVRYIDV